MLLEMQDCNNGIPGDKQQLDTIPKNRNGILEKMLRNGNIGQNIEWGELQTQVSG